MYANSGPDMHHAKPNQPCDGVRYKEFSQNEGLMRHHIVLDLKPYDLVQRDKDKETEMQKKKSGARPCGGKFYIAHHSDEHKQWENPLNTHKEPSHNLETRVNEHKNHYDQNPAHHAHQQVKDQHYSSQRYDPEHDLKSVEQALYHEFKSAEHVKQSQPMEHSSRETYHKVKSETEDKGYARPDEIAEQVEKKYNRIYEESEQKNYHGADKKPRTTRYSPEKENKDDKETELKAKKPKNELDRHTLPSGLRPVQKRPGRSDRKGKKGRSKNNSAERSKSGKQQKVNRDSRKIQ